MAKPSERLRQIRAELREQFEEDRPGEKPPFTAIWIEAMEQFLDEQYESQQREQNGKAK